MGSLQDCPSASASGVAGSGAWWALTLHLQGHCSRRGQDTTPLGLAGEAATQTQL